MPSVESVLRLVLTTPQHDGYYYAADLLNYIALTNHYETYLEIGVAGKDTFNKVCIAAKECVDPKIEIGATHIATSDQFFEACPREKFYDLIYIDGFHDKDYLFRDIENSLKHLSPGGTIMCHDCMPRKQWHTRSDWNGTCYEGWIKARRLHYSDFRMFLIALDHGYGIIQPSAPPSLSFYPPEVFTWQEYIDNYSAYLNILPTEYALDLL